MPTRASSSISAAYAACIEVAWRSSATAYYGLFESVTLALSSQSYDHTPVNAAVPLLLSSMRQLDCAKHTLQDVTSKLVQQPELLYEARCTIHCYRLLNLGDSVWPIHSHYSAATVTLLSLIRPGTRPTAVQTSAYSSLAHTRSVSTATLKSASAQCLVLPLTLVSLTPSLLLPLLLLPQGALLLTSVVHSTLCKVNNYCLIYMVHKLHSTYILELCRCNDSSGAACARCASLARIVPLNGSDMPTHCELQLVTVVVARNDLYLHRIA
eukprot:11213-Heterococcus_DN1.PRE.2